MYSNNYAQSLIVAIPMFFFLNQELNLKVDLRHKLTIRIILTTGLLLMIFNLLFTTSRSATIGFLTGFIWWFFLWQKWPFKSKRNLWITSAILITVLVVIAFILIIYFDDILSARPGSFNTRITVYKHSLASLMERPLLGWGALRNFKDVFPEVEAWKSMPPLGSLSTYLGILYKNGIIGFAAFLWFLIYIFKFISGSYRKLKNDNEPTIFALIGFAGWGFVSNLTQGFFNMLDLDSLSFHIMWINMALIVSASRFIMEKNKKILQDIETE